MTEFSAVRSSCRSRCSISMRRGLRRISAEGRTRLCTSSISTILFENGLHAPLEKSSYPPLRGSRSG